MEIVLGWPHSHGRGAGELEGPVDCCGAPKLDEGEHGSGASCGEDGIDWNLAATGNVAQVPREGEAFVAAVADISDGFLKMQSRRVETLTQRRTFVLMLRPAR